MRVVSGGTTYFAHVDGLDPADLERAAGEAAAALRGERAEPRPLRAVATSPQPIERRPEDVPAERKAELLRELDERGRSAGGEIAQLIGLLRRGPPRGRRRQLRRPAQRRRPHPHADRRPGRRPPRRAGRDRRRDARRPPRLRAARRRPRRDRRERRRARRSTLLDAGAGAGRLDAGRGRRRLRRRPLPRDDRPRARGRPRPEGRQRLRRQARRAGRPAAAERLRRRPPAGRVGQRRDRRRGHADPEDAGDRGRPPRLLPLRPAAGRARRRRLDRQRPPRELPPPADPADDQHLHRPRRGRAGGDHRRGRRRASTRSPSPAARSTRRPATSSSASARAT